MSSSRPNLTLDEQSFQGLLSAAFIIQQHNDRRKLARDAQTEPEAHTDLATNDPETNVAAEASFDSDATLDSEINIDPEAGIVCPHCGALKAAEGSQCDSCGLDEFRPGERLQRNWASMWLMSQEQNLWPTRPAEVGEAGHQDVPPLEAKRNPLARSVRDFSASNFPAMPDADEVAQEAIFQEDTGTKWAAAATEDDTTEDFHSDFHSPEEDVAPEDSDLTFQPLQLSAGDDSYADDSSQIGAPIDAADASPKSLSLLQRLADLRVTLRFRRADLYLGTAVLVATFALLWPAASSPQRAALGPFDRLLVTLGIAEAPAPVVHLQGDPSIEVWIDPHSALYYCPGEEPYGKTPNGHFSSQRDAQMDRFEPSGRSACE
jgi:hypothetical protein